MGGGFFINNFFSEYNYFIIMRVNENKDQETINNNINYDFIDVGKAFAFFCVVIMHTVCDNENYIFKIVQMGCMAYFFFASGFCFKESNYKCSSLQFLAKNVRTQLIPYFIGAFIGIFVCYKFPNFYTQDLSEMFQMIFIECRPIAFGLVWFLWCLFQIRVVFFILWKLFGCISNNIVKNLSIIILYIIFIFLSVYLVDNNIRLQYKIDVSIVAMTFYILGFLVKHTLLYKYIEKPIFALMILFLSKTLSIYLETYFISYSNIVDFISDNYYIYQIIQILSITSFMCIGMLLSKIKLLIYLGKNTFYPYLIHTYILWVIEELYGKYVIGVVRYSFYDLGEILFMVSIAFVISYVFGYVLKKIINS